MMLEAHQEIDQVMGSSCELITQIIKGKRTKRPRPLSEEKIESIDNNNTNNNLSSPSSSIEFVGGGEEEEDMANCLILLAQGTQHQTRKPTTTTATKVTCSGPSYVYQCKTCNRCFSSFQALGGHRASHKKPNNKIGILIEEKQDEEAQVVNNDHMNTTLSLQIPNRVSYSNITSTSTTNNIKSNKVHECSICGAEFSSGQALGGHMRRHRAAFATTSTTSPSTTVSLVTSSPEYQEIKKVKRNSLQLDLNLPAPEDHEHRDSKFHFPSKEQVLVFSASSLVDCHY